MFLLWECLLYGFIIVYDLSWIKYLSIIVCFFRLIYEKRGYGVFCIILVADYFLLWSDKYEIGIYLFMIVQCIYHMRLNGNHYFYLILLVIVYPQLYVLGFVYALMTLWNIVLAFYRRHWLFVTLILLALCDLCIVTQFLTQMNIPYIWWFYLPSQVWYTKMVLSSKERTIVKEEI